MKTTTLRKTLGTTALLGAILLTPVAFAADSQVNSAIRINGDGMIRVVNAEITSISGNIINAIARFKNLATTWTFTTNASTTVAANNSMNASTSALVVGDRINVSGTLTSLGSTIGVNAAKIVDVTSMASFRSTSGTVQSVNTQNGTFVLKSSSGKLITVQTNSNTLFGVTSGANTQLLTLATIGVNSKVKVSGTASADGTILTATKVTLKGADVHKDNTDKKDKKSSNGFKNGWNKNSEHKGFLKTHLGLKLGNNN